VHAPLVMNNKQYSIFTLAIEYTRLTQKHLYLLLVN